MRFSSVTTLLGITTAHLAGVLCQSPGDPPPWHNGAITEDGSCGPDMSDDWVCTPTWGACCGADGRCGFQAACGDGW